MNLKAMAVSIYKNNSDFYEHEFEEYRLKLVGRKELMMLMLLAQFKNNLCLQLFAHDLAVFRGVGLSLRTGEVLRHPKGAGRRVAPSWHLKEPIEVVCASDQDASGVLYMFMYGKLLRRRPAAP